MVATVVGEVECEVLVVDARHLVAVVADEVGIIHEVIQIVCLDNQAVAVESRHVAHLVVEILPVVRRAGVRLGVLQPSERIVLELVGSGAALVASLFLLMRM